MQVLSFIFFLNVLFLSLLCISDAYSITVKGRPRIGLSSPSIGSAGISMSNARCPTELYATTSSDTQDDNEDKAEPQGLRGELRKITGFSLTAFRSTWRAATGISLTAVYASAIAASGLWIRQTMSKILSVTPPWFRYFLQPFLVLYYAPLFIIRGLTGPTRKNARAKHQLVVDGWKEAVVHAEDKTRNASWPAHVNDDGDFELDGGSSDTEGGGGDQQRLADAVAESVEQASEQSYKDDKIP